MKKFLNFCDQHILLINFLISVVIWIVIFYLFELHFDEGCLENWIFGIRKEMYSTIASISGALLGFIITALSIVLVFAQSPKINRFKRSKHYSTLYKIFILTIKYLGYTTITSVLGIIIDKDSNPQTWIFFASLFGVILSAVSMVTTLVIMELLIKIITQQDSTNNQTI